MRPSSEIIQRITGTYIEDESTSKGPLLDWIQIECRHGCHRKAIEEFLKSQPEPFRSDLVIVEKADGEKITLRVPARVVDHESPSTFAMEAVFELNPVTQTLRRL